jgi:hypothetical protein
MSVLLSNAHVTLESTHIASCSMNDVDDDVDEMHMEGEATVATHDVSGTSTSEQSSAMLSSVNAYVLFALVFLLQIGGFLVLFMRTRMLKTIASTTSSIEQKLDFSASNTTTHIEADKSYSTGGVIRVTTSI